MTIRGNGGSVLALTAGALAFWAACATAVSASAAPEGGWLPARMAAPAPARPAGGLSVPGQLHGVAAASGRDAWAVGFLELHRREPILAHWDGRSWITVSSPADLLFAVSKFPGGYWAVGSDTIILRLTGSTVRRVRVPAAGAPLYGVTATSATNAWAVGGRQHILHWNGTAWKPAPVPFRRGAGPFVAVAATSAGNAWAVARNAEIVHWNGRKWSHVASPTIPGRSYTLSGVAATSAKNAWAVGTTSTSRTLILHWNGRRWRRVPSPNPNQGLAGDGLLAVAASSAGNAWAVGFGAGTLAEHWDGASWKVVPTPGCCELHGISILPSGRAWAVGTTNSDTLIIRWNGTAWH